MLELPPLWSHQKTGIARALAMGDYAFFMDMGVGKTRTTLEVLRNHYNAHKRILRTLILCPRIVVDNWPEEFAKYTKVPPERIVMLLGDAKKRKAIWDAAMSRFGGNFIAVTNYEKLVDMVRVTDPRTGKEKRENRADTFLALLQWEPEIIIADESHKLKDLKSARTQAVLTLASRFMNPAVKHKYLLTGTPVLKDPLDLFSQFLILDDGATLGKEFWPFKLRFMEDRNAQWKGKPNYFPKWEIKAGALDEINAKIQTRSMSVKKEECMDLPPLVKERRYVDLSPEQRRLYMEMKRDFITFINDKACTAQLALTKALRLMQISSGYVQAEDGSKTSLKNTPKMEALSDLLEELAPRHKVLVWACFKENYEQIRKVCEDLGLQFIELHGDVSDKDRFASIKRFNEDPSVRICIGHPGSGGIGVNLTSSSYSVFYSRDFSYGNDAQARARNYRGGSEVHDRVTHIDLVAKGTIDEVVLSRLEKKEEISESVLRDIAHLL